MKHKNVNDEDQKANLNKPLTDNITEGDQSADLGATSQEQPEVKPEEDLSDKLNELNDRFLRLHAEFDNYRKRSLKERIDLIKTASEDLIKDLLPVLDDFDRALKSFETTENLDALKEGVTLIYNKFKNTLTCRGLEEIKTLGEDFNVDSQEAVAHIPAPEDGMKNKVIDEVQKGYTLNNKVIRFAKVVVGS